MHISYFSLTVRSDVEILKLFFFENSKRTLIYSTRCSHVIKPNLAIWQSPGNPSDTERAVKHT